MSAETPPITDVTNPMHVVGLGIDGPLAEGAPFEDGQSEVGTDANTTKFQVIEDNGKYTVVPIKSNDEVIKDISESFGNNLGIGFETKKSLDTFIVTKQIDPKLSFSFIFGCLKQLETDGINKKDYDKIIKMIQGTQAFQKITNSTNTPTRFGKVRNAATRFGNSFGKGVSSAARSVRNLGRGRAGGKKTRKAKKGGKDKEEEEDEPEEDVDDEKEEETPEVKVEEEDEKDNE